jgi:hypothetical protein
LYFSFQIIFFDRYKITNIINERINWNRLAIILLCHNICMDIIMNVIVAEYSGRAHLARAAVGNWWLCENKNVNTQSQ